MSKSDRREGSISSWRIQHYPDTQEILQRKGGIVSKNRILMFDVMRIAAIVGIVLAHIWYALGITLLYSNLGGWRQTITSSMGGYGVAIFLLVSGCVIEYTYGEKVWGSISKFDFVSFIEKRILRLYPAYWFSILLGLLFGYNFLATLTSFNWLEFIKTMTGFVVFFNLDFSGGYINPMGWFIGVILCLYFLFPMISRFLKNNGIQGLVLIFLFVWFVRITIPEGASGLNWYWFPLSRMAEFALGIYMVQTGLYLKTINTSKIIQFASDLSFPIFLVHFPVLYILTTTPQAYYENLILYVTVVLLLAYIVYLFDLSFKKFYGNLKLRLKTRREMARRT